MFKKLKNKPVGIRAAIIGAIIAGLFIIINTLVNFLIRNNLHVSEEQQKTSNIVEIKGINKNNIFNVNQYIQESKNNDTIGLKIYDITKDSAVKISVKDKIEDSCEMQINKVYTSRFQPAIEVFLSNRSKSNIFIVDTIELEIIESKPFKVTSFPDGPWAIIKEYKLEKEINPFTKNYLLDSNKYKYSPGELEAFKILLKSDYKYWYKIFVTFKYFNLDDIDKRYKLSSSTHSISFPDFLPLKNLIKNATSIDFYLNYTESIYSLLIDEELKFSLNCNVRFIFSDKIKNRWSTIDRFSTLIMPPYAYNLIPDSIFHKSSEVNPSFYKESEQFMIINDSILVFHISYGEGQIFTDSNIVYNLKNFYDKYFSLSIIESDSQLKILSKNLNIPIVIMDSNDTNIFIGY